MSWFKVDDGLHSSKKLMKIPKRHRWAAIGLWTVAGSWAADQLTDGHVPDHILGWWGVPPTAPGMLVTAGLWERVSDGYVFCNWSEYQPRKEDVDAERAASRERMRELRARRKQPKPQDSAEESEVFGRTVTNRSESVRNPDPTRPDPLKPRTHQSSPVTSAHEARGEPDCAPSTAVAITPGRQAARLGEPQKAALRIVHAWEGTFPNRPPQRHIDDVTAEVQRLVNEGIPPDQIAAGLKAWSDGDSYSPRNIPTHVAKAGRQRQATGTTRAQDILAIDTSSIGGQQT